MQENKSKKKFTLRIILSYLILGGLALASGIFILSEAKAYLATNKTAKNDTKLIKTSSLLTQLYEAESLSKLALQNKTKESFSVYAKKIDSVSIEIDSLKNVITSEYQLSLLDSVQELLKQKTYNNEVLRRLKLENEANSSLDAALNKFLQLEASFDKISIYDFNENPEKLPDYERKVLDEWVALLNANVPDDGKNITDPEKIDSIIRSSKKILSDAKNKDLISQRNLAKKEKEINKNDLELSQQLRNIITAFEEEVIHTTNINNQKKDDILKKSTRLAGIAALLGFLIVGIFTFLITRDYWQVQAYRQNLEKEKKFSESLLKSRDQLIATVSHDLRTPLNTISGYSELIENTSLTQKQTSYFKNIKSATSYVDSLVNDLLDYSKLEAGKLKTENIPFNLSDLLNDTALELQEINKQKKLELHIEIDNKLEHMVLGDPFRLRQIITNLISNAYKFTHKGHITIKATVTEKTPGIYQTIIHVIDSGIGIEEDKQETIFKEFTQADDSTEKKYGGYGLGLTISKKLADLLNGTLSLESEKGSGSVFTLQIPLKVSKVKVKPKTVAEKKVTEFAPNLSILIIDDDLAMLRLLKEVCETSKIKAITYSDFSKIPKQNTLKYDVVLTDIQMPNITGFEVIMKLKKDNYLHYNNQPVLAMTGRKDLNKQIYSQVGFVATLQKPFTKNQFLEQLSKLFPKASLPKEAISNKKSTTSSLYNLNTIKSFIGDNNDSLIEVLHTFLKDTDQNIIQLKKATQENDFSTINSVSHRMLSMFRQVNATDSVAILEAFEKIKPNDISDKELKTKFNQLQNNCIALKLALNANETINLNYNG
ncbi:response regulator [Cellulophaga baltica]|uniref:hybrid sensor histidine kinase/response regulator n=1 Tax=Cellulophaga TaxID=104264 RepID=UPI001C06555A|nr:MULTISPECIES: ATP-binding protein [Cellulophaga]MBU2995587.1 response regulator [Cellulophaga baltica]MDO6766981.1 ATP-binding protein [Cellulophaga sp. 1_MG-2023]